MLHIIYWACPKMQGPQKILASCREWLWAWDITDTNTSINMIDGELKHTVNECLTQILVYSILLWESITPCILQHLAVLRSEKWLRSKNAGSCIQLCLPQVPPCWIIHHLNRLNIQSYYLHGSWQHQLASDPSCGSNNVKPTKLAEARSCSYPGLLIHPALQLKFMIVEGYHCSKSCWDTPLPIHGWPPTVQCGM